MPSAPDCPYCGSENTIATPEAGEDAPYHCNHCDRTFTRGQVQKTG